MHCQTNADAAPGDWLKPASGSWHLEKDSGVLVNRPVSAYVEQV
ncbi:hypothetical protein [Hydrogenophaga sp.]|nr:hypothetical protein [Hydrogenophaga sp.]